MERTEVAENMKWKTSDIFPSDEAWEKEFKDLEATCLNYDVSVFYGKLHEKETLLECLKRMDEMERRLEMVYLYAHLRHDEDLRVAKYTSAQARVIGMFSQVFAKVRLAAHVSNRCKS